VKIFFSEPILITITVMYIGIKCPRDIGGELLVIYLKGPWLTQYKLMSR